MKKDIDIDLNKLYISKHNFKLIQNIMSITGSINLSKINRDVLIKGEKGTYMNVKVVLKDEKDEYGNNGFIAQKVSKEQYEAGVKGEILGNIRVYEDSAPSFGAPPVPAAEAVVEDDLPFF